ncbi:hypothetical protein Godav_013820, partial [Gossypium davidsonii]|nr:hypothetical protein [Gossypium davidsonii]
WSVDFKFVPIDIINRFGRDLLSAIISPADILDTVSVFVLMLIPDFRSFKGWQKNAITAYLGELSIKIGKPNDFI